MTSKKHDSEIAPQEHERYQNEKDEKDYDDEREHDDEPEDEYSFDDDYDDSDDDADDSDDDDYEDEGADREEVPAYDRGESGERRHGYGRFRERRGEGSDPRQPWRDRAPAPRFSGGGTQYTFANVAQGAKFSRVSPLCR